MNATNGSDLLVLVGDRQRARVVKPGAGHTLDVVWEAYAATPDVRSLAQAPDAPRNSPDATAAVGSETNVAFAHDVAERVRVLADARPGLRLLVIAPRSFAGALEAELGDAWPTRAGDVALRDETMLDDDALRTFIDATVAAHALAP